MHSGQAIFRWISGALISVSGLLIQNQQGKTPASANQDPKVQEILSRYRANRDQLQVSRGKSVGTSGDAQSVEDALAGKWTRFRGSSYSSWFSRENISRHETFGSATSESWSSISIETDEMIVGISSNPARNEYVIRTSKPNSSPTNPVAQGDYMCWQAERYGAEYEGEQDLDGRNLQVFRITYGVDQGGGQRRVWVDPERGHFPVRSEIENQDGEVWKIRGCLDFIECFGGRWAPRRWFEAERNRIGDGSFDPSGSYWVLVAEHLEFAADEQSGEEIFRVAVSPGKYLYLETSDRLASVIGETYRLLGNELDVRWFNEDGSFKPPAGVAERVARNPADHVPEALPQTYRYPPVWAIGTVLLCAVLAVAYRFRRKRTTSR